MFRMFLVRKTFLSSIILVGFCTLFCKSGWFENLIVLMFDSFKSGDGIIIGVIS